MRRRVRWLALVCGLAAASCIGLCAAEESSSAGLQLARRLSRARLSQPVFATQAPGDAKSWYVVEKAGRVLRFASIDAAQPSVFVDLSSEVDADPTEAGLLSIAFHPRYPQDRRVFLCYTSRDEPLESRVVSLLAEKDGSRLLPGSETRLLSLHQPYVNHNGGEVRFGPDGYLYIGLGDGGSAGDPQHNGQNPHTFLGTILRVDVAGTPYAVPPNNPFANGIDGAPEVYAYGLRNPWRFSFDRQGGALWVGDVGQDAWEEIDVVVRGGNYGWNIREGRHCYARTPCDVAGLIDPVLEYPHQHGNASVTGGYVYRGKAIPALSGRYVFGDFVSGRIWSAPARAQAKELHAQLAVDTDALIASFAEGNDGELYVVDYRGGLYALVPRVRR